MPLLTRTFPAYFRLGALFEVSDISTTSEPTVPSGIVSFGLADPVCARHLGCKGSLTPRPEVGSLRSPSYGQPVWRLQILPLAVDALSEINIIEAMRRQAKRICKRHVDMLACNIEETD
jgi:hypothetical protein